MYEQFFHVAQKYPAFGRKMLTYEDLRGIAASERITISDAGLPNKLFSLFLRQKGRSYILISNTATENGRWFLLGHELGHYFLHPPQTFAMSMDGNEMDPQMELAIERKVEREANLFSTICFLPNSLLDSMNAEGSLTLTKVVDYTISTLKLQEASSRKRARIIANCIRRLRAYHEFRAAVEAVARMTAELDKQVALEIQELAGPHIFKADL